MRTVYCGCAAGLRGLGGLWGGRLEKRPASGLSGPSSDDRKRAFCRVTVPGRRDRRSDRRPPQGGSFIMDTISPKQRSEVMAKVRSKNTRPEMVVRRLVHGLGYRYRLHRKDLPGTPDLVFPGRSKVIFVHGCFWHRHADCPLARLPKSRQEFWVPKLAGNADRDAKQIQALRRLGWSVMTIWECEVRDLGKLERRIRRFLDA